MSTTHLCVAYTCYLLPRVRARTRAVINGLFLMSACISREVGSILLDTDVTFLIVNNLLQDQWTGCRWKTKEGSAPHLLMN